MNDQEYKYNGQVWKACSTVADENNFFHAVFGEESEDHDKHFFDEDADYRRMVWMTFLKYYEKKPRPDCLNEQLKKCFDENEKFQNLSPENKEDYTKYMKDVSSSEHQVIIEEIQIMATLQNIKIILFINRQSKPIIIEPNFELVGKYMQKNKSSSDNVVICLEDKNFSRLNPVVNPKPINNENIQKVKKEKNTSRKNFNKGGTAGIEGGLYQINLLIIFLLNGHLRHENWYMSTENEDAGKFDDLVFEFGPSNTTNFETILLQAKHKKSKKKKISYEDLLTTNSKNDDFSLPKYFFSFEQVKNDFKVQNVIICTNADLKLDKKLLSLIHKENINQDSMLYFEKVGGICYTFNDDMIPEIKQNILEYYKENLQGKDIDTSIICEDNIKNFFKHLQFIANYPNKGGLDEIIEKIISQMNISENLDSKDSLKYIQKKMIDWFKEEKGRYLTQKDAKSFFCEIRSNRYREMLQNKIYFRNNKTIFNNGKRIFHFVCEKEYLLNAIKIHQILPSETLYVNPDEDFNFQKQIIEAFEIPVYSTLLIISLKTTSDNLLKEINDKITGIIKNSTYKKLILIAKETDKFANLFKVNKEIFERFHEKILFSDLVEDSQNKLLNERFIYFQNKKNYLKELLTVTSHERNEILGDEILTKLVKNDAPLHIGNDNRHLDADMEKCYIDRIFIRGHNQILSEENMCQLKESNKEKIVLISDAAGTGKSTVLTSMAMKIKNNFHHLWVIRINLNSYTKILDNYVKKKIKAISVNDLLNSEDFSRFKSDFEERLFLVQGKVILMLDGVDEISPNYTDLVISLLSLSIKSENIKKIFVTTRSNIQGILESTFSVESFYLQSFSLNDQIYFLKNYWMWHLKLQGDDEKKCEIYTLHLMRKVAFWSINAGGQYKDKDFAALPQQIKMLAEVFADDSNLLNVEWEGCKNFINSNSEDPKFPSRLNLIKLYQLFIEKKQQIFIDDKGKAAGNLVTIQALENELKTLQCYHYKLAFEVLFEEEKYPIFKKFMLYISNLSDTIPENSLVKLGIIQKVDERLFFIHRTFAEYFVSEYLIKEIIDWDNNQQFHDFFICELLTNVDYKMIRNFFDNLLEEATDLQQLPENIFEINPDISVPSKIIFTLATEGCIEILKFVFHCYSFEIPINIYNNRGDSPLSAAAYHGHLDVVNFLVERGAILETEDEIGFSALFNAAFRNHLDVVKYLVEKGADYNIVAYNEETILQVSTANIDIVKFLVSTGMNIDVKDAYGQTALFKAAYNGHLETVKFLVKQGADITIRDIDEQTVLDSAIYMNHIDVIKFLINKGADFKNINDSGRTILHAAAEKGYLDTVEYLIDLGINFNEADNYGMTPLHCASSGGHLDIVKYFLNKNNANESGKIININAKDNDGKTPLHYAHEYGFLDIVGYLIENGADSNISDKSGMKPLEGSVKILNLNLNQYLQLQQESAKQESEKQESAKQESAKQESVKQEAMSTNSKMTQELNNDAEMES